MNYKTSKVLEVAGGKDQEGQNVQVAKKNGSTQQKWRILYADKMKARATKGLDAEWGFHLNRPFYIRTKMITGRTVEALPNGNLVLRTIFKDRKPQMFTFSGIAKTIESIEYPGKSLDIEESGKSANLRLFKTNARWFQMFRIKGDYLVNERGLVVEIQGNRDNENSNIGIGKLRNAKTQQWIIAYADELVLSYEPGELNP
jgi:hypothetical protein